MYVIVAMESSTVSVEFLRRKVRLLSGQLRENSYSEKAIMPTCSSPVSAANDSIQEEGCNTQLEAFCEYHINRLKGRKQNSHLVACKTTQPGVVMTTRCGDKLVAIVTPRQLEKLRVEAIQFRMESEVSTTILVSASNCTAVVLTILTTYSACQRLVN